MYVRGYCAAAAAHIPRLDSTDVNSIANCIVLMAGSAEMKFRFTDLKSDSTFWTAAFPKIRAAGPIATVTAIADVTTVASIAHGAAVAAAFAIEGVVGRVYTVAVTAARLHLP